MEFESMLFITNHTPYLWAFQILFPTGLLIFRRDTSKNEA